RLANAVFVSLVLVAGAPILGCRPSNNGDLTPASGVQSSTLEGTLRILIRDNAAQDLAPWYDVEVSPGKRVKLVFAERPDAAPGARLRLVGESRGNEFHVKTWTRVDDGATVSALTGQPVQTTRKIAVLMVNFGTPDNQTIEAIRTRMFTGPRSAAQF